MTLQRETFINPPAEWRSMPFWSLNDWLEADEITRQLDEFHRGGYGGAYLHSRTGLETHYLGEDWWTAMDAGRDACERLGLECWFYDEDRWPSGFAGGEVPLASEAYHTRCLMRLEKSADLPQTADVLAEDDAYRYVCYKARMGDPWFNGTVWVDLGNPDTVKAFLDCSYDPYVERYRDDIKAGLVKGIFTDEPQVSPKTDGLNNAGALPFTPGLLEDFQARNGYDLRDHFASLFEEAGDWKKVRLHYYQAVARRFEGSFSRQIGQYCDKAGIEWTGHLNGEENFRAVTQNVGNAMLQYRHFQRPGIDFLGLHINGGLNAAKSCSSVANQVGRTRRLSEMFGISGQNMNFEDRKWIADWHAVCGINHVCPHLSLYSMRGCRKRDYPPTLSPQQPWWPWNTALEDHLARMSYASTVGRFAAEMLVIHPLESSYFHHPDTMDAARAFEQMLEGLMAAHRDWDFGDEALMSEIASTEADRITVGEMSYPAVVLPMMTTLRRTTLDLLLAFARNGGTLVAVEHWPSLVDAEPDEEALSELARAGTLVTAADLTEHLAAALPPGVTLEGRGSQSVYTQRRAVDDGQLVMLTNTDRLQAATVSLKLNDADDAVYWCPDSGQSWKLQANAQGVFELHLAPAQAAIVTTSAASSQAQPGDTYLAPQPGHTLATLDGEWNIQRLDPNALTLDFARWSADGETFRDAEPVIAIFERLMEQNYEGPLTLIFSAQVATRPAQTSVVVENPELYRAITVNGQAVDFSGGEFYRDHSFRQANCTAALTEGANEIRLELDFVPPAPASPNRTVSGCATGGRDDADTPFWQLDDIRRYGTEIESIYLIGDFGVAPQAAQPATMDTERNQRGYLEPMPVHWFEGFTIGEEPAQAAGDLTPQGYPFFAGRLRLTQTFELPDRPAGQRIILQFAKTEAQVLQVEVNGQPLPPVVWKPLEVDITDAVQAGTNTLSITVVNSLRNLLGPHHHVKGEMVSVGPGTFTGAGFWASGPGDEDWIERRAAGKSCTAWRDAYACIPLGLLEPPSILSR